MKILIKHSGRYCSGRRCGAELIQRPDESDIQFLHRKFCIDCQENHRDKPPMMRPVKVRATAHRDVLPSTERTNPQEIDQYARHAGES